MKRLILCGLIGISLCGSARAAITNSLVGYWKFNETGAATTAADASGFNHPGTVKNFTGTHWVAGVASNALNFDGANDHVIIPNYTKATNTLSVAAWVWADSRPIWASIAKNWGDTVAGQFHLGLNNSSGLLEIRLTS